MTRYLDNHYFPISRHALYQVVTIHSWQCKEQTMNKKDFRNPLIQSGAVLLFVFLLISIVANAGTNSIIGSISALFSGLISGILFLFALCVAIIISIAVIIGLFIAAVSIHSVDKARDMYSGLKSSLCSFYGKCSAARSHAHTDRENLHSGNIQCPGSAPGFDVSELLQKLQNRLARLEKALMDIQTVQAGSETQLSSLHEDIKDIKDDNSSDSLTRQFSSLAEAQQTLHQKITNLSSRLDTNTDQIASLDKRISKDQDRIQAELEKLRQKTSVPDVITGILSYIDVPEDREKIAKKAEEAVSRGMTYTQIDAFFKSSLAPKVYTVLSEHPRLTKDFLRSVKKKFA